MRLAIVAAKFTPEQANGLRRAMATFRHVGQIHMFEQLMVKGMTERGYDPHFAARCFEQIKGFGSYGFPESHAASFAQLVYVSSWIKRHHPAAFACALLNAQPMGFYAPAQIVRDARAHGVEVLPPSVNDSRWDTMLLAPAPDPSVSSEENPGRAAMHPLRLGLRLVRNLSNLDAARILAARSEGPFASIEDVWRRSGVPVAALERLAEADGFACFGIDRRQALWQVRGLADAPLPLFAGLAGREAAVTLRPLSEGREVVEDYRAIQLSLRAHPLVFLRPELEQRGVVTCAELERVKDGGRVEVAGIILVRQKPGSAKGVLFVTIEDETGVANAIVWPAKFEAQRRTILSAAMIGVVGRVQKEGLVIHVIADHIVDYTPLLRAVGDMAFPHRPGPGDGATHGGGPDRRDPGWERGVRDCYHKPFRTGADPEAMIRVKTRDFH